MLLHKLFGLGAFNVEPAKHRVVFSQHAIARDRRRPHDFACIDSTLDPAVDPIGGSSLQVTDQARFV